jgi:glycosyltransferase involved in cell wall biosynthesis
MREEAGFITEEMAPVETPLSVPQLQGPRVSVVTVFYDAEEFIEEAIESALAQTFDNWELLLVDDGSTDRSSEIAIGYSERRPERIRYLQHENHQNRGISVSQNLGIKEARGEYIAFLDSDDVWLPQKLADQVRLLDSIPEAAFVYGATTYWYSWSKTPGESVGDLLIEPGFDDDTLVEPPVFLVALLNRDIPVPCPSDVLARRNILESVGGFEERFKRLFTDQAVYAKIGLSAPVLVSTRSWFKYRRHNHSSVQRAKAAGALRSAQLDFLTWLQDYLSARQPGNLFVHRAVKRSLFRAKYPTPARILEHVRYRYLILRELIRKLGHLLLPARFERWLRAQLAGRTKAIRLRGKQLDV